MSPIKCSSYAIVLFIMRMSTSIAPVAQPELHLSFDVAFELVAQ